MTPSRLRWGIFWILVGLVILANNLGWLSWWVWADLLHLWPLLLIAIGLELIVKKSRIQWLGYFSTLLILGAFIWVIAADRGWEIERDRFEAPWRGSTVELATPLQGQQRVSVDLTFHGGRLYFDEGSEDLFKVRSQSSLYVPELRGDEAIPHAKVTVRPRKERHGLHKVFHIDLHDNNWRSYLHRDVPARVDLSLDDCDLRFDSRHLQVDTLELDVKDSDLVLRFGTNRQLTYIEINGEETDLFAYLPYSAGVNIEGIDPGSSAAERFGLVEADDFLINDLFGQAAVNFYFKCDLEDGRLRLRRY